MATPTMTPLWLLKKTYFEYVDKMLYQPVYATVWYGCNVPYDCIRRGSMLRYNKICVKRYLCSSSQENGVFMPPNGGGCYSLAFY